MIALKTPGKNAGGLSSRYVLGSIAIVYSFVYDQDTVIGESELGILISETAYTAKSRDSPLPFLAGVVKSLPELVEAPLRRLWWGW
jgi:hypothetical protein